MPKIFYNNQELEYQIRRSRRARHLRLTIRPDATIAVTLPWRAPDGLADQFVKAKLPWIRKHLDYYQRHAGPASLKLTRDDYLKNKAAALALIQEKVKYFNQRYGFKYGKITVRNQQTRWGSCSRQGNLNFNYRLMFLTPVMADYIIVHELCHLREPNHSPRFWALVAKTFPNHQAVRQDLKRAGLSLL